MSARNWKLGLVVAGLCSVMAQRSLQSTLETRNDGSSAETFELKSEVKGRLFSRCAAEANTVSGTLHSIELASGSLYTRHICDSAHQAAWEAIDGVVKIIDCAVKASEAGASMFKFPKQRCMAAFGEVYDTSEASCQGEEVFITNELCTLNSQDFLPGQSMMKKNCVKCGSGGVVTDEDGNEFDPNDELDDGLLCCQTQTDPCIATDISSVTYCEALRKCIFNGWDLPEVATAEQRGVLASTFGYGVNLNYWVNIDHNGTHWLHIPSMTPVADDLWRDGIPEPDKCIGMDRTGTLEGVDCKGKPVLPTLLACQEATQKMVPCA